MRIELYVKAAMPQGAAPYLGYIFTDASPNLAQAASKRFWRAGSIVGARIFTGKEWKKTTREELEALLSPKAEPAAIAGTPPPPGNPPKND